MSVHAIETEELSLLNWEPEIKFKDYFLHRHIENNFFLMAANCLPGFWAKVSMSTFQNSC